MWPIALTGIIAVIAWLYQRAWERQRAREEAYSRILDTLPSVFTGSLNPSKTDEMLSEMRRMLLFAPGDVILKAEAFLESMEESESDLVKEGAIDALIQSMRQDCSYMAMIVPKFGDARLPSTRIVLKTASKARLSSEVKPDS